MKTRSLFCLLTLFLFSTIALSADKVYVCINEKGEKIFSIKAQYVSAFSDGMAAVEKIVLVNGDPKRLTGFIDTTGKLVIKPKYEKVYDFSYGVAWVMESEGGGYYLINKQGDRLTTDTYQQVGYFFEGFCDVFDSEGKMGFINREGKLVIPCEYLGTSFSEGLACVMPYNDPVEKYGFIDTAGAVVIPFQYKQAGTSSFENGECRVQINGITCLINKRGEVVFKPALTKNTQGFYEGLSASYTAPDRTGWGFYNRSNVWVIKPEYDYVQRFNGGLAIVQKQGKYGVIDTTGKVVIPIQYANMFGDPAEDGWYGTEMEEFGEKVYINAKGEPFTTVPMLYLYPTYGSSLLPYQDPSKKYGFLYKDGSLFMEAQFDQAWSFHEGKAWVTGGDISKLSYAPGSTEADFVKEYVVGEKIKSRKNGKGEFFPGTISQVGENYYLIRFDDGTQEWVVWDSIKRPHH